MTRLEDLTRQLWAAAFFIRQGGGRKSYKAMRVLSKLKHCGPPVISARADQILKEIRANG